MNLFQYFEMQAYVRNEKRGNDDKISLKVNIAKYARHIVDLQEQDYRFQTGIK